MYPAQLLYPPCPCLFYSIPLGPQIPETSITMPLEQHKYKPHLSTLSPSPVKQPKLHQLGSMTHGMDWSPLDVDLYKVIRLENKVKLEQLE